MILQRATILLHPLAGRRAGDLAEAGLRRCIERARMVLPRLGRCQPRDVETLSPHLLADIGCGDGAAGW